MVLSLAGVACAGCVLCRDFSSLLTFVPLIPCPHSKKPLEQEIMITLVQSSARARLLAPLGEVGLVCEGFDTFHNARRWMGGCSLVHTCSLRWLFRLVLTAGSCQGGGKVQCKEVGVHRTRFRGPRRGCVKQHGWERKLVWDLLSIRHSPESGLGPCASNCTFI